MKYSVSKNTKKALSKYTLYFKQWHCQDIKNISKKESFEIYPFRSTRYKKKESFKLNPFKRSTLSEYTLYFKKIFLSKVQEIKKKEKTLFNPFLAQSHFHLFHLFYKQESVNNLPF